MHIYKHMFTLLSTASRTLMERSADMNYLFYVRSIFLSKHMRFARALIRLVIDQDGVWAKNFD